ncbi:MAG TPA: AtpZ/AtpI family protein [Thermoguttaceae bacterium]|nr:AtpZ/AtpI family protein [Thermoguttaceae bacterium]
MNDSSDDRSPLATAMAWSSRVTAISLEMALPGLIGYWVGRKLGAEIAFVVLGVLIGLVGGMWHLIRLTRVAGPSRGQPRQSGDENEES